MAIYPTRRSLLRAFTAAAGGESLAYRMSMLRKPPTERGLDFGCNSCSLIGTVVRPVTRFAWERPNEIGVYTILHVKNRSEYSDFELLLDFRGNLAVKALRHLKLNDFIYVNGPFGSYEKHIAGGKCQIFHKVFVKDLNFIKCSNQIRDQIKSGSSRDPIAPISGTCDEEESKRERLHLLQIFFANPYEWWDNRQGKPHPNYPDFKHKDTRECLWLKTDDPPWVRRQLELYESKKLNNLGNVSGRFKIRQWNIEDL